MLGKYYLGSNGFRSLDLVETVNWGLKEGGVFIMRISVAQ
jgi:hypothetical protein